MKKAVNVFPSYNTSSGKVWIEDGNQPLEFTLRCTVKRCHYRTKCETYSQAERLAYSHAGAHQFGGYTQ